MTEKKSTPKTKKKELTKDELMAQAVQMYQAAIYKMQQAGVVVSVGNHEIGFVAILHGYKNENGDISKCE